MMRTILLPLLLAATVTLCSGQSNSLPPIKWRTIAEGSSSQIKKAENHFLHTSGDIQTWWAKHSGQGAHTVPYKFDPNKEFAVAIHLGERKSGGYKVYVETVARSTPASGIIATVELTPPKGSTVTQSLTQPWVLIAIERPGVQDWQFRRITATDTSTVNPWSGSGCCTCKSCKCSQEIYYNPAPMGQFSVDNTFGIRTLGRVPFTAYFSGIDSDISRESVFVIQSERQYADYWGKHREHSPTTPPSGLDWSREQLLAVHMGLLPSLGYELKVVGIERTWQGSLNVLYGIKAPPTGTSLQRRWNSPYTIIRMSRITEPITFVRRDDLLNGDKCGCCAACKH